MHIEHPHRRYNPLTGEWILVSPHRSKRPWNGGQEETSTNTKEYDPQCYLCPGNTRNTGEKNLDYTSTYVFVNDFQAIYPNDHKQNQNEKDIFITKDVSGTCRVICFSPKHNLTLAQMEEDNIRDVIRTWIAQVSDLGKEYMWIQLFENKGEIMGCSNPHPHCQVWASNSLPTIIEKENENQLRFYTQKKSHMLIDYVKLELKKNRRVIEENDEWAFVVPYWALWPYETILIPKKQTKRITDLTENQQVKLASILKAMLSRYDKLFNTSFPYSMGFHGAPFGNSYDHWTLHAHFFPPLLRSATVKKFMVGYELLAEAQRDLTPENAALALQAIK